MSYQRFEKAIQPMLIICKLFGMIPFQISNNEYKISWPGIFYNIILIIAYLCGFGYMMYRNFAHPNTDLILHTITTLQNLSGLGVVLVVWISSLLNQKQYIRVLDKINEIDKSFRNLGVWPFYGKIFKTTIKLIIGKCICVIISFLLDSFGKKIKFSLYNILISTMHSIPLMVYTMLSLQVYIYLKIIKIRYAILNQHLKELQKDEKISVNILEVKNVKLTSPLGTKLSILRVICPLHHELCKAANMFNDIYGISLLITFGQSFVSITTNMYYIIRKLKFVNMDNLSQLFGIMGAFLINIIESIWVCWICHTTIEEAENTGILLHKIDYEEVELKNQIEMFSLQIAHETLEFSAAGFFPINFTLLYSIVGGVTTYLVILMQLSGSGNEDQREDD